MDPLSLDRISSTRPLAAESASLATGHVVPVAPVNPSTNGTLPSEPSPSVINLIGQNGKSNQGEGVYSSVSDPTRSSAQSTQSDYDWSIKKPKPQEQKPPPEPPLYQLLIDHIKHLWLVSAGAVQVQQQVKDELNPNSALANASVVQPLAQNSPLTYLVNKVSQTEKTLT
jgi:hypothetical protein